jgi:hypothetical protein
MAVEGVAAIMDLARVQFSGRRLRQSEIQRCVCYDPQCANDKGKAASRLYLNRRRKGNNDPIEESIGVCAPAFSSSQSSRLLRHSIIVSQSQ